MCGSVVPHGSYNNGAAPVPPWYFDSLVGVFGPAGGEAKSRRKERM